MQSVIGAAALRNPQPFNTRLKPLTLALLSMLAVPTAHAADTLAGLGTLGGTYSYASAISADGSTVVGNSGTAGNATHAFRWSSGSMSDLGTLGGAYSSAIAVSADGSTVAGYSGTAGNAAYHAFRWSSGSMSDLGTLGGTNSSASAVSADGSTVAGQSSTAGNAATHAFRWSSGSMSDLGTLGGTYSSANAVSADGSVVVGDSNTAGNAAYHAFRWSSGSMSDLGTLGGTYSFASAVSADGSVVVGASDISANSETTEAFRWQSSTGMQSVAAWLSHAGVSTSGFTSLDSASGVSASGNTVVGYGTDSSGHTQAYIARVDPKGSGIVGLTDLGNSMRQTLAVTSQIDGLTALAMNGAHHRTLMDNAMTDGESCGWVNGDLGRVYRQANGYTGIAEIGACHDLADHSIRVGLGVGSSYADLDLANHGHSRLNGEYGLAEIDWQLPNSPVIASLLGTYGQWDADLKRGYAIAGTAPSKGSTDVTAYSLRARLDWTDAFHLGQVSFSPRVAYTVTRTIVDGFQETGGSAPASFAEQNHTANEARLGLTGKYALNDKTTLLGHGEVVHRFDDRGATIQGNINALGVGIGFNQVGNAVARDWVRLGAEVDYRINPRNMINASTFVATAGQDADITAALSWKFLF